MLEIREVVVVEGRYDKARVCGAVRGVVIELGGFRFYSDKEKQRALRKLAAERGAIILTDNDAAGFQLRAFTASLLSGCAVRHAYLPDRYGKERRKREPSKEGKIGVEGYGVGEIEAALRAAGASEAPAGDRFTPADLVLAGLSGGEGSADRRRRFLASLGLPSRLSSSALCAVLSATLTRAGFERALRELSEAEEPAGGEK